MDLGGEEGGGGGMGSGVGGGDGDVAARYERDLVHKLKLLRHELSLQQPQAGHCRIEVSREEIFEVGAGVQPRRNKIQTTGLENPCRKTSKHLFLISSHAVSLTQTCGQIRQP